LIGRTVDPLAGGCRSLTGIGIGLVAGLGGDFEKAFLQVHGLSPGMVRCTNWCDAS
jgi:hypothetical protein